MKKKSTQAIRSVLNEDRMFPPPKRFASQAHISSMEQYRRLYAESIRRPEKFWARMAREIEWFRPFRKILQWKEPFAKWFVGGQTNVSYNCLDRHVLTWRRNKAAIVWEGEPMKDGRPEIRTLTYQQLHREVCKFGNVLKTLEIRKGDRVILYMPMCPELAIGILACARIGATHSVVFGGFSADAIRDRVNDCGATAIITADGCYRRGSVVHLKASVDSALENGGCPSVQHVVVFQRLGETIPMHAGRDHWWHERMAGVTPDCPAEKLDSEHPLFVLYTSGSTGKPKGVLHTTAGYLLWVHLTTKWIFDLREEDTYWCTADIGWVTGHSYVVYGPLSNGATTFLYEGAPNYPEPDRFWSMIARHRITILYTAPTAIRAFMKWGEQWPLKHDLSTLRLLGTVGEPINPEAWMWYYKNIGKSNCPVVDTWWQTETGGIMVSPFPGATPAKPGTATLPLPGVDIAVVDRHGDEVGPNEGGYLVIRKPWPAMLRTIYGDAERYRKQYWSEVPHCYFTGDGARRDGHGYVWIMGRIDDVINVSGHRLGTAEIESALVHHPAVAEAAVLGRPDDLKGQAIVAFVTLRGRSEPSEELRQTLAAHVTKQIGALARPDEIRFADGLPKTRSGKIMRRLLREIATNGRVLGDTTTLEDFSVLEKLRLDEE